MEIEINDGLDYAKLDQPEKSNNYMRGLMVFRINVGTMPPDNANKYIDGMRETFRNLTDKLRDNDIESCFLPIRTGNTKIYFIDLE